MKEQEVILVNADDVATGTMDKLEAHRKGLLHRAFSVFIFDGKGRMLLQQRAAGKYHGSLLWTNACCSHPYPNENVADAAQRRLYEELGFQTPLKELFSFTYYAPVENGLIEHEFDHVFAGEYDGEIRFNKNEVAAIRYEEISEIHFLIASEPETFTSWFRIAFPKVEKWRKENEK